MPAQQESVFQSSQPNRANDESLDENGESFIKQNYRPSTPSTIIQKEINHQQGFMIDNQLQKPLRPNSPPAPPSITGPPLPPYSLLSLNQDRLMSLRGPHMDVNVGQTNQFNQGPYYHQHPQWPLQQNMRSTYHGMVPNMNPNPYQMDHNPMMNMVPTHSLTHQDKVEKKINGFGDTNVKKDDKKSKITQKESKNVRGTSSYVGVRWHKASQKWQAQIYHQGHVTHLGLFDREIDAAKKFDEKAASLGKALNFPLVEG